MAKYYVNRNAQDNGDHEVHKEGCTYMPETANRVYLGNFTTCQAAVQEAKENHYSQSDGCYYCIPSCHTS